ncbi:MAG: hypothetical protein EA416_04950 [Trueperaceae bacterium]|nr:MAG: hypothetical protein EA416_04950 [Trueperaceae bacterium]
MRNVFVLALDAFNRRQLERVERASDYRFHPLLGFEDVKLGHHGKIPEIIERASDELERFARTGGSVDGIIGFWDFPVQTLVPILRARRGLPGPTLESVFKCEHKYWSRLEQREVVPDQVPSFTTFDPHAHDVAIELEPPYWVKPVKSAASQLCFLIETDADLEHALAALRQGIERFGVSFDQLLSYADLPDEVAAVTGHHCIAETALTGDRYTLSGYAVDGEVVIYGVVDSLTYPGRSSFARFQYPSKAPAALKERMIASATTVIRRIGFDREAFNIEFLHDRSRDLLGLLEINPRMSQSHGDLYARVDGLPNQKIVSDLAVGRRPEFPRRQGAYAYAAKCYLRQFTDAVVTRVPDAEGIARIEREVDGALIDLKVAEGMRLSELSGQDAYSYALAWIYVGGDSEEALQDAYARCVQGLGIGLEMRA